MTNLRRGMDRLFDEMMGRGLGRGLDEGSVRGSWAPAVDILEKEDAIEIRADLPGFKADDVDVTVDNGVLTVRGERRLEEASEGETYHRVERSYGMFERTFSLPNSVDLGKIEARFKDGEMHVNLPKREESKPRSVKIKVESK
jgi:HSP20 family protein